MIKKLCSLLTASSLCAQAAVSLEVGSALPKVTSLDQESRSIELGSYAAQKWLLVYFYPKADTPGCTKQACSLRDSFADLTEKGVIVFGVSKDSPEAQKKFQTKHQLPFSLLADSKGLVLKAFGVPTYPGVGLPKRQAFLFHQGKLVWKDLSASTQKQAADVLAEIEKKEKAQP